MADLPCKRSALCASQHIDKWPSSMTQDAKIGLVTFADMRFHRSLARVAKMAHDMDVFHSVSAYTELDLPSDIPVPPHSELRKQRGFGFWFWKPIVALQALDHNPDLDILFYCDAGCHIRAEGRRRLFDYSDLLTQSNHDFLAFNLSFPTPHPLDGTASQLPDPDALIEAHWTKGDMFHAFGVAENSPLAQSPQVQANVYAMKNCRRARDFLQRWITATENSPHLFTDAPSMLPNFRGFVEHRHDQSWFSLSLKQLGYVQLSASSNSR